MPIEEANKRKSGFGRGDPNQFPTLPEPKGRMTFDLMHPLDFLKDIIGPSLYNKLCKTCIILLCAVIAGLIFLFWGGAIMAEVII